MSIKDMEIDFSDYEGITLIDGKNVDSGGSVGSGKSSILEAVVWGLFGKTIRKSTEASLINNQSKKDCYVILQVNDNMFITRGKKPTRLEFVVDDKNLTQESAKDTQDKIEEILEINYKLFLSSAVFGQHNLVEFLSATPEDKRTIIRHFLNLDNVFNKRDKIRSIKSDANNAIKVNNTLIKEYEKEKKVLQSRLDEISKHKAVELDELGIPQKELEKYTYDELIEQELAYNELLKAVDLKESFIIEKEKGIVDLEDYVTKGPYKKSETCSHCRSVVEKEVTKKDISFAIKDITGMEQEVRTYKKEIKSLKSKAKKAKPKITPRQYGEIQSILTLINDEDNTKVSLLDLDGKIADKVKENKDHNKQLEVMKFWEVAFSEKGLIRYVISNILEYFNEACNHYLKYLSNGDIQLTFDEKLQDTILNCGKPVFFIGLSGGEKKKVNLAVAMALQKLLLFSTNAHTNILFLDEIGESLDFEGVQGLYILLEELNKTKDLFIITHNKYLKNLLEDKNTLQIEKRKGVTKLRN